MLYMLYLPVQCNSFDSCSVNCTRLYLLEYSLSLLYHKHGFFYSMLLSLPLFFPFP